MATYKYSTFLAETRAEIFDDAYEQGSINFHSGIYRCLECNAEITVVERGIFPPCGHHPPSIEGHTLWRLIARANHI
jgi:hypothetical protein